jgi:hypothetical protein
MRLIDADELSKTAEGWVWDKHIYNSLRLWIEECPTIEAIPISFIEEQAKLCNEIGFRRGEECYTALIEKWRKEHEIN